MCTNVMRVYKCSLKCQACIGHAPYYIVICALPGCTIYFHNIPPKKAIFSKTKLFNIKRVFWFSLQLLLEIFFILRRMGETLSKIHIGLHVECPLFLLDFNETWIFEKYSNIKFHENPSGGSRVVPCGRTDTTKLTGAIRNFASARKKCKLFRSSSCMWAFLYACDIPRFSTYWFSRQFVSQLFPSRTAKYNLFPHYQ
jgi:hypothetical protein